MLVDVGGGMGPTWGRGVKGGREEKVGAGLRYGAAGWGEGRQLG